MSGRGSIDEAVGLEHVTASLRRLPTAPAGAADRILAAALQRRRQAHLRRRWLARAAMVALSVGVGASGVWYGRRSGGRDAHQPSVASAPTQSSDAASRAPQPVVAGGRVRFASSGAGEDAPVSVGFALRYPGARRVALVGDFDEWSPTAEPMHRTGDGIWITTVQLAPGRHAYAFVVNDTQWVTDPRTPLVRDPDYGREQSVIVVGQP